LICCFFEKQIIGKNWAGYQKVIVKAFWSEKKNKRGTDKLSDVQKEFVVIFKRFKQSFLLSKKANQ
jgi:hypothetical protein